MQVLKVWGKQFCSDAMHYFIKYSCQIKYGCPGEILRTNKTPLLQNSPDFLKRTVYAQISNCLDTCNTWVIFPQDCGLEGGRT